MNNKTKKDKSKQRNQFNNRELKSKKFNPDNSQSNKTFHKKNDSKRNRINNTTVKIPRTIFIRYREKFILCTESFNNDLKPVYEERILKREDKIYREWMPKHSKIAAAIYNGLDNLNITENSTILYLGAASGTTVSHLSDIVTKGLIFSVEISPYVFYKTVFLSERRKNIVPIFADANKPEDYFNITLPSDLVFQDISQKNQVEIFLKNSRIFLKKNGLAIISVKSRSIDVTKKPRIIFNEVRNVLEKNFNNVKEYSLTPYQKEHTLFVCSLLKN